MDNSTAEEAAGAAAAQTFTKISVATPVVYFGILLALLVSFSVYHKRSKIQSMQKLTSTPLFFPSHNRDWEQAEVMGTSTPDSTPALMYNDLVELGAHDKMLKSALVMRASEAMRRLMKLKECEQGVNTLYTRGLIGDESFQHFKLQLKLQDAEMRDVVLTAERLHPTWGQSQLVIANAQEVTMNQALRRRVNAIDSRVDTVRRIAVKGVEPVLAQIQAEMDVLKAKTNGPASAAASAASAAPAAQLAA